MTGPRLRLGALGLVVLVAIVSPPRDGGADALVEDAIGVVLPLTPGQARELLSLLGTPDRIPVDLDDATRALLEPLPALPAAVLHDVVHAVPRHLRLLHSLVTDVAELPGSVAGRPGGLFCHTVRSLYDSAVFSAAAATFRRLSGPGNRTVRLAIVLAARTQGVPLEVTDLDAVRQAIDRDAPDLAPLVARAIGRLARLYGKEALHLALTP